MIAEKTIIKSIQGSVFKLVRQKKGIGILINGIKVSLENIYRNETRVDLKEDTSIAYVIEHPLAVIGINGIHCVEIIGTRKIWDFCRPSDREAFARNLEPSSIVGPPNGSISDDLVNKIKIDNITETGKYIREKSVTKLVKFKDDKHNQISLGPPRKNSTSLNISLKLFNLGPIHARYDVNQGLLDFNDDASIRKKILQSRSAAVIGLTEESLYHALGDLVADICVVGGFTAGELQAQLGFAYHSATIGLARKIMKLGIYKEF
ncbi:MAG: hypothetical protein ACTSVI_12440 [Promethearchaeota archaeon]